MSESMNFQQAVNYVMQSKMAAFAFLPKKQEEIIKGCELFILTYCDMHEEEPDEYPEYNLQYLGGYYYDSSIEEGSYWPEEIPDEAKSLSYFKTFEKSIDPGNEIQITLKQLNGIPSKKQGSMRIVRTAKRIFWRMEGFLSVRIVF